MLIHEFIFSEPSPNATPCPQDFVDARAMDMACRTVRAALLALPAPMQPALAGDRPVNRRVADFLHSSLCSPDLTVDDVIFMRGLATFSPDVLLALDRLEAWANYTQGPSSAALRFDCNPGASVGEALNESADDPTALKAIFLTGSGGAGKGVIGAEMFAGTGLKVINQDIHLERLLKKAAVPLSQAGSRYDLFQKARDYRNMELEQYGKARLGLLIDSTGWEYSRIAQPYRRLKKLGYDCYMIVVRVSLPTALRRNELRAKTGGRGVPASYVDTAWRGLEDNLLRYRKLFGARRFFVIDNDKDVSPEQWASQVVPKLEALGRKILAIPVHNPVGINWLAAGKNIERPVQERMQAMREKRAMLFAPVRSHRRRAAPPSSLPAATIESVDGPIFAPHGIDTVSIAG
jgi:predicted ABC-type ATPase